MSKEIVIYGAGGFGREVQWLIERINCKNQYWKILGYIDDVIEPGTIVDGYRVLGNNEYLKKRNQPLAVALAIGSAKIRRKIAEICKKNIQLNFPNLIDPSVICSERITLGEGNIICAGNILTVDIKADDFNIINLDCTVGHDVIINSFVTVYPSVNISGMVTLGRGIELGTGTQIIQGISISDDVIIGAGTTVIRNITTPGTYVGSPARRIAYEK